MKNRKMILLAVLLTTGLAALAQQPYTSTYQEKEVFKNDDVVFRQIDAHTWEGNGHLMANESLYLIEGNDRSILLDAGTKIADLDKIVAKLTTKPVTLIATHVHPDHTGEAIKYFPKLYLNAADVVNIPQMMPQYKGEICYLKDSEVIDLGGRQIEVRFAPGHTPGSTVFFDKAAGYGFSGDAFGSGNLLVTTNISTVLSTCQRISSIMEKENIKFMYPGHYMGKNPETLQRLKDMIGLCNDILSGKRVGEKNPHGMIGLDTIVNDFGVRINYNSKEGVK